MGAISARPRTTRNSHAPKPSPGPSTLALGALAKSLKIAIVGSLFERRAPGLYHNAAVILDADGTLAGIYRKMHIPDDPLYYEKFYFTPGDLGFKAVDTEHGWVGTLVCWDQWYPEAARLTALQGAMVLFYPTAIGWQSVNLSFVDSSFFAKMLPQIKRRLRRDWGRQLP